MLKVTLHKLFSRECFFPLSPSTPYSFGLCSKESFSEAVKNLLAKVVMSLQVYIKRALEVSSFY
jgi:hypothetical protein